MKSNLNHIQLSKLYTKRRAGLPRRLHGVRGWAVLESTMALIVVLTLVSVGFGLVQYINASSAVERTLDRIISDTAVKPFVLTTQRGRVELALDHNNLNRSIDNFSQQIREELDNYRQERELMNSSSFAVETVYAEVDIDSQSGHAKGVVGDPFSYRSLYGDPSLFALNGKEDYFKNGLLERVRFGDEQLSDVAGVGSTLAAPTAEFLFDAESSEQRFLSRTIIVGGRVVLSLEESYVGDLLGLIGVKPTVYYQKFVPLRGEIAR